VFLESLDVRFMPASRECENTDLGEFHQVIKCSMLSRIHFQHGVRTHTSDTMQQRRFRFSPPPPPLHQV